MTAMRLLQQEFATGEMGFTMSICAAAIRQAECLKEGHDRTFACSLNYLIGARDERRRYGKPQLLGCLEVDGQLEFGYLVDWDVAGLCSSENCVDIVADALIQFDQVEGVGH